MLRGRPILGSQGVKGGLRRSLCSMAAFDGFIRNPDSPYGSTGGSKRSTQTYRKISFKDLLPFFTLFIDMAVIGQIWGKLGTALQAYTMNPCTKFPPNTTSRKVDT